MRVSCLRMSRNEARFGKFSGFIFENGGVERSRLTFASDISGSNAASQRCGRSRVVGAAGISTEIVQASSVFLVHFPLALTLSLREREQQSCVSGFSKAHPTNAARSFSTRLETILPLLGERTGVRASQFH